jgi:hypothetical protein
MLSDSHSLKLWKESLKMALNLSDSHTLKLWKESLMMALNLRYEGWSENKFTLHVLWIIFCPNKKGSGVIVHQGLVLHLFDLCLFALVPHTNVHHF